MILGVECDFTLTEGNGSTRGNNFLPVVFNTVFPKLISFFFFLFNFFFPTRDGWLRDILLLYREIQPLLNVVAFDLFLCRVAERQHIFCGGSGSG